MPGVALFAKPFRYADQVISAILLRIPSGKLKSRRICSSSLRVDFITVAIVLPAAINFTVLSGREEKAGSESRLNYILTGRRYFNWH
jgi:hypothetical protein